MMHRRRAINDLAAARGVYDTHVGCARRLRAALQMGRDLLDAFETKRPRSPPIRYLRPWRGPRKFTPATKWWYATISSTMARRKPFVVGGEWLRRDLDAMLCAQIDQDTEARLDISVVTVWIGWSSSSPCPQKLLSPTPEMTMRDISLVFGFVDMLRDALEAILDMSPDVAEVVCVHMQHFEALEEARLHAAAAAIQSAWRRARDTPGYTIWRRRMLREFSDLTTSS